MAVVRRLCPCAVQGHNLPLTTLGKEARLVNKGVAGGGERDTAGHTVGPADSSPASVIPLAVASFDRQ